MQKSHSSMPISPRTALLEEIPAAFLQNLASLIGLYVKKGSMAFKVGMAPANGRDRMFTHFEIEVTYDGEKITYCLGNDFKPRIIHKEAPRMS